MLVQRICISARYSQIGNGKTFVVNLRIVVLIAHKKEKRMVWPVVPAVSTIKKLQ